MKPSLITMLFLMGLCLTYCSKDAPVAPTTEPPIEQPSTPPGPKDSTKPPEPLKPKPVSKTDLLTNGGWKIVSQKKVENGKTSDLFALMAACKSDDVYVFAANNFYSELSAQNLCTGQKKGDFVSQFWQFTNNEVFIRVYKTGPDRNYKIMKLTEGEMILESYNDSIQITTTYTHVEFP